MRCVRTSRIACADGLRDTSTPPMMATPLTVITGPPGVPVPAFEWSKAPMMPTPVTRKAEIDAADWALGSLTEAVDVVLDGFW